MEIPDNEKTVDTERPQLEGALLRDVTLRREYCDGSRRRDFEVLECVPIWEKGGKRESVDEHNEFNPVSELT